MGSLLVSFFFYIFMMLMNKLDSQKQAYFNIL